MALEEAEGQESGRVFEKHYQCWTGVPINRLTLDATAYTHLPTQGKLCYRYQAGPILVARGEMEEQIPLALDPEKGQARGHLWTHSRQLLEGTRVGPRVGQGLSTHPRAGMHNGLDLHGRPLRKAGGADHRPGRIGLGEVLRQDLVDLTESSQISEIDGQFDHLVQ